MILSKLVQRTCSSSKTIGRVRLAQDAYTRRLFGQPRWNGTSFLAKNVCRFSTWPSRTKRDMQRSKLTRVVSKPVEAELTRCCASLTHSIHLSISIFAKVSYKSHLRMDSNHFVVVFWSFTRSIIVLGTLRLRGTSLRSFPT